MERGRCLVCGREVATYVPRKGDGSERVAYRHLPGGPVVTMDGVWCDGSHREVADVSMVRGGPRDR